MVELLKSILAHLQSNDDVSLSDGGHSVQISDSNVDNTMTLCHLRRPSGCPLDYT